MTFKRTKIANHGIKDVEIDHSFGNTAEFVVKSLLLVVEEFGAHDALVWALRLSKHHKKKSVILSVYPRIYWTTYYHTRKHTDKPHAFRFLGR